MEPVVSFPTAKISETFLPLETAAMDGKSNPGFLLRFLIFICLSLLHFHVCLGADTISANQSLTGDQSIVSAKGVFALGFFKPGNSSNYYIGMWYNKISVKTYVWVANRENPVSNSHSSELRISSDGNLVLLNASKVAIWSTNVNSTTSNVEAVLGDDGNLVLRQVSTPSEPPLWQSFDHPADTWLPGAKIGLNNITKKNTLLISWKSREDPSPGLFSLELDPSGSSEYLNKWNRSKQYWSSGPWDNQTKIFRDVPEMRSNYIYNFTYIDNANESYFTYDLYNSSIVSRFLMHFGGQVQQQTWLEIAKQWNFFWAQPKVQCDVYAYCGAFGSCNSNSEPFCNCLTGFDPKSDDEWDSRAYSGGCKRINGLQCGNSSLNNGKADRFLQKSGMGKLDNGQIQAAGSARECESACLRNCSCTAYSYDDNQCSIWLGDLLDLKQLGTDDPSAITLFVRLSASEFLSSNKKGPVIGAVGGSIAAVLLVGLVLFVIFRRKRRMKMGKQVVGSLLAFGYKDLQAATKNFSDRLGGGGFGSVFKGVLPDSSVIAVKKLESVSQGEKQFRTEVSTIGTIQHVNLVRLLGFCSDGTKRLLVYEHMPNGSLDSQLFHEKESKVLYWETRYAIALGTARGLTYLHEKCRDCIIHCDVKPENILLDAEFCPKVADFGLAKLVGRDFSRVLTTMRGTRGYLAPEWISGVPITAKADVYSYGMMLFEFISGRRNTEQSEDGKVKFFPSWAASQMMKGDVLSLLDPKLEEKANVEELTRMCRVAIWCIQDDEAHRPSMGQVVQILEGTSNVNPPPIPRPLQVFVDNHEQIIFFTESSSSSSQSSQSRSISSTSSSQTKSHTSSKILNEDTQGHFTITEV